MRALRKLAWVAIGLLALAVTGIVAYGIPQSPKQSVQLVQTTSSTTPAALDLPPPGVLVGNACSVGQIQIDLDLFNSGVRLFGHDATNYEAELFGRDFYGCTSFTS